ncbi:hypothetical protein ACFY04_16405 [Streptomyces sp. NPDC001549]|uniref:hypothetical protein n=1 Tax=Streptomyces sp. NPDC001549 TaxID=3364586 RepID=UPI00369A750A
MRKMLLRRPAAGKALVVSALLALSVPGIAYANTVGATVKTPGATMGPGSAFSEISTSAACSSGLISGGGIAQAIGTGTSSNGNKINGTSPSPDGSTEYTGSTGVVGTDLAYWLPGPSTVWSSPPSPGNARGRPRRLAHRHGHGGRHDRDRPARRPLRRRPGEPAA